MLFISVSFRYIIIYIITLVGIWSEALLQGKLSKPLPQIFICWTGIY